MIFPLSNKITGPIADDGLSSLGSGNGSISSSELDYCGNDLNGEDSSVNENSVVRVPARVWATLILINAVWIISRLLYMPAYLIGYVKVLGDNFSEKILSLPILLYINFLC